MTAGLHDASALVEDRDDEGVRVTAQRDEHVAIAVAHGVGHELAEDQQRTLSLLSSAGVCHERRGPTACPTRTVEVPGKKVFDRFVDGFFSIQRVSATCNRNAPAATMLRRWSRTPRAGYGAGASLAQVTPMEDDDMGLIRKSASIGTLGIVSYRSKKEKLRRAERAHRDAEQALVDERVARENAEARISSAEKRVKHALSEAAGAAKQLERSKRRRQRKRGRSASESLSALLAAAEPTVRDTVDSVRTVSSDAADRGRRVGRKARKAAQRSARDAKKSARKAAGQASEKLENLKTRS